MTIDSIRPASHILASINLSWPQASFELLELRHAGQYRKKAAVLQDFSLKFHAN
jgi:hypothetical protein